MTRWRRWKARILKRTVLVRRPHMTIVEDRVRIGKKEFTYVHRPHGPVVAVVALTSRNEMVLVRQYRHPVGRALLEIPAGGVEGREPLLRAAKRELLEETGYSSQCWKKLGRWYPSPAHTGVVKHVFLALDVRKIRGQHLDDTEFLRVEVIPLARLWKTYNHTPDDMAEGLLSGIALAHRTVLAHRYGRIQRPR